MYKEEILPRARIRSFGQDNGSGRAQMCGFLCLCAELPFCYAYGEKTLLFLLFFSACFQKNAFFIKNFLRIAVYNMRIKTKMTAMPAVGNSGVWQCRKECFGAILGKIPIRRRSLKKTFESTFVRASRKAEKEIQYEKIFENLVDGLLSCIGGGSCHDCAVRL